MERRKKQAVPHFVPQFAILDIEKWENKSTLSGEGWGAFLKWQNITFQENESRENIYLYELRKINNKGCLLVSIQVDKQAEK